MTKKAKVGGTVQVGGQLYDVLQWPERYGHGYRMMVRRQADQGGYWVIAPRHQCGKGPWKISGPVISTEA